MVAMLTWRDPGDLGRELAALHPDKNPLAATHAEVRRLVAELPGFGDDPDAATDEQLEEIQAAWFDAMQE
jgi:FeS assembly protein IscX